MLINLLLKDFKIIQPSDHHHHPKYFIDDENFQCHLHKKNSKQNFFKIDY